MPGRTPKPSSAAIKRVADGGIRPGTTTDDATRIATLEREVPELRRGNEILKTSAALFDAAELDRKIK